jgi:hypothetical protein
MSITSKPGRNPAGRTIRQEEAILKLGIFPRLVAIASICAATLTATPVISGIYNAASYAPPNLTNSGVAQGAIFVATGTSLGPETLVQAQSYPLPTTAGLAGTTAQVTVSGVTETCIMIYSSSTQIAGIIPSATPTGSGQISFPTRAPARPSTSSSSPPTSAPSH